MESYLIITTIANPNMLEDALRAILDSGISGSTVLSGKVYSMHAGEQVIDEFEVAPGIGEMLGLKSKDGRAILSIVVGREKLANTRSAITEAMDKFGRKKGFGYTVSVVTIAEVAGLPRNVD